MGRGSAGRRVPVMENLLIRAGAIGAAIAALCCFTAVPVIVLGIAGLSAWLDRLDLVAVPMLALFGAILVAGLAMRRRRRAGEGG